MWFFPVLNIFLLRLLSLTLQQYFLFSLICVLISDLKFVSDLLPKAMLAILFVSRLNRDSKSFSTELFHVYLAGLSTPICVSLMILFWIKL